MNWYKTAQLTDTGKQRLDQSGYQIIDQKSAAGYDLFLTYHPMANFYQLGFQKSGKDFTDIEQQKTKQKMNWFPNFSKLSLLKQVLQEWSSKYGKLWIKSHSPFKDKAYETILRGLGIPIQKGNLYGTDALYVEF